MLPSALINDVGTRVVCFRSSIAHPAYTPVYASLCTSRYPVQDSGPSRSLVLSRKNFPFSASSRFNPAHLSGHSAQDHSIAYLVLTLALPRRFAVVPILRHWRPSPWANTELSRITVAECSACQTWIIAKRQFSIASARQLRAESTSTPSTSSSPGTAPSLDWPSTASSWCAIACTWNRGIWPPTPSTSSLQPCVAWLTKPPTPAC